MEKLRGTPDEGGRWECLRNKALFICTVSRDYYIDDPQ